jgi:molybdopterin converting factor small subunit
MTTNTKLPGQFTLLYFASASSFTSKTSESLPAPLPISKLFDILEEKYSGMKAKILESCLVTVNLEYVDLPDDGEEGTIIKEGDEVAIIPPVSSG